MSIILGSTELNKSMIWTDRTQYSNVVTSVNRTITGRQVIQVNNNYKGRPITLEAISDQGWLTTAMVDAVQAMADTPGGIFQLQIRAYTFTVMFRHYDAPAFTTTSLIGRSYPVSDDVHTGTIKLFTI